MVTVSISETYDLSTVTNKMTLIGIHTPKKELIQKTYPGLCMNSKFFRILKTDVILSCVSSSIAITPDMVGDNSVDGIAPEDMLNPILYKACSNDSWSTLDARLMGLQNQTQSIAQVTQPPLQGNMAFAENDNVTGLINDFGVYYSLLSHSDGFRHVPVQRGLTMRGLKPLVFDVWYSHGENKTFSNNSAPAIAESSSEGNPLITVNPNAMSMRGRAHRMPRINTTYLTGLDVDGEAQGTNWQTNGMGNGRPVNFQVQMPDIAPVMLGAIIMPPCRKTKLFYRMTVRTYIRFEGVRPIQDVTSFAQMDTQYAPLIYHSDYNEQSKRMDETTNMVDVKNGSIEKIMEGR